MIQCYNDSKTINTNKIPYDDFWWVALCTTLWSIVLSGSTAYYPLIYRPFRTFV